MAEITVHRSLIKDIDLYVDDIAARPGMRDRVRRHDFYDNVAKVSVSTLVLHVDVDGTLPFAGSGTRVHAAIRGSELRGLASSPHGCTVSHAEEWDAALPQFLAK